MRGFQNREAAQAQWAREQASRTADMAFERAIAEGRLSANRTAPNYAGNYMFMGTSRKGDMFKNINTRQYLAYGERA